MVYRRHTPSVCTYTARVEEWCRSAPSKASGHAAAGGVLGRGELRGAGGSEGCLPWVSSEGLASVVKKSMCQ